MMDILHITFSNVFYWKNKPTKQTKQTLFVFIFNFHISWGSNRQYVSIGSAKHFIIFKAITSIDDDSSSKLI